MTIIAAQSGRMCVAGAKRQGCRSRRSSCTRLGSHAAPPITGARMPRQRAAKRHSLGKRQTQRIERKPLTLRTWIKRLARKTMCFSTSVQRHALGIGLFVTRSEFGLRL